MARFMAFYTDPAKRGLQRFQIGAMVLLIPVALMIGVPALKNYLAFQEAGQHLLKADELTHQGKVQEALVELEKCVELYPGFYEAYELMASLNYDRLDRSRAIDAYHRGLKALPDHGELHYGLAQLLYLEKRYDEAIEHGNLAQASLPGDVRVEHLVQKAGEHKANPDSAQSESIQGPQH